MRIRHSLYKEIVAVLDNSRFTAADFQLEFPDVGDVVIRVTFKSYHDFKISLSMKDDVFSLIECPADFYYKWTTGPYNYKDFTKSLKSWAEQIYIELKSISPIFDDFEDLRREVESQINRYADDIDLYFTESEAMNVRGRLDLFAHLLEHHAETHVELATEIDNLLTQLNGAKATIEAFPKKVWLFTTFNKIMACMKPLMKSKEVRQLAVEEVKALVFQSIIGGKEEFPRKNGAA